MRASGDPAGRRRRCCSPGIAGQAGPEGPAKPRADDGLSLAAGLEAGRNRKYLLSP